MAKKVLGTRERTEDDRTLQEAVSEALEFRKRLAALRKETSDPSVSQTEPLELPETFRHTPSAEIRETAKKLVERSGGPENLDPNAAMALVMDGEVLRRHNFEQRTGIRTPDPLTGLSSLD